MKRIFFLFLLPFLCAKIAAQDQIVYDIDSNLYHMVTIGNQTWLQENLKVTHFNNGDKIATTPLEFYYMEEENPKYRWPCGGDEANLKDYGRLYTFFVAVDKRKVCPIGWRVANDADWTNLEKTLGGRGKAAGKLKESGFDHWNKPNAGEKKRTNFKALPGGDREASGGFNYIGNIGYWWTSTEENEGAAYARRMMYDGKNINQDISEKHTGMAIRCIKE